MKLWIDDVRPAPEGYVWVKSVYEAQRAIEIFEGLQCANINYPDTYEKIELIDTDHDSGDFGPPDYIKLLDWLEETGRNYPIHIHSMNPVGAANMRVIIKRNGWKEVF